MERPGHYIDYLLQRRLREAAVSPPTDVWEGISRELRRRRRRLLVLWWSAGLLLLGVAGAGLWWWSSASSSHPLSLPESASGNLHPADVASPVSSAAVVPVPRPEGLSPRRKPRFLPRPTLTVGSSEPVASASPAEQTPLSVTDEGTPMALPRTATSLPPVPADLCMPARLINLSPVASTAAAKKTNGNTKKCYSFGNRSKIWLLDFYGGPTWSVSRWRLTDSELDAYASERRRTESPEGAFNIGARLSYCFHPNFLLRTGLHYDHWVERFEYFDPNVIRYHVVITQKLINGTWTTVADTLGVEYGAEYIKTYNRFGLLDLPVQAGLEWRTGAAGVSLNVGASVNLWFHQRGSFLDTTGKPVSFTPGSGGREVYCLRVGLSGNYSVQGFYHLTPNLRVFVEPYLRVVFRPVTLPSYPIEQYQSFVGLRVGLSQVVGGK